MKVGDLVTLSSYALKKTDQFVDINLNTQKKDSKIAIYLTNAKIFESDVIRGLNNTYK